MFDSGVLRVTPEGRLDRSTTDAVRRTTPFALCSKLRKKTLGRRERRWAFAFQTTTISRLWAREWIGGARGAVMFYAQRFEEYDAEQGFPLSNVVSIAGDSAEGQTDASTEYLLNCELKI